METQDINNDIANLPPEAQQQIFDFIEFYMKVSLTS